MVSKKHIIWLTLIAGLMPHSGYGFLVDVTPIERAVDKIKPVIEDLTEKAPAALNGLTETVKQAVTDITVVLKQTDGTWAESNKNLQQMKQTIDQSIFTKENFSGAVNRFMFAALGAVLTYKSAQFLWSSLKNTYQKLYPENSSEQKELTWTDYAAPAAGLIGIGCGVLLIQGKFIRF